MSAAPSVLLDTRDPQCSLIDVLTLTPFYPSSQDETQGCFVSEPVALLKQFGVRNHVIAVRPFHRGTAKSSESAPAAEWKRFVCVPGNHGLASSGALLFAQLARKVSRLANRTPMRIVHAHSALPSGHAAMLMKKAFGIPFVVSVHGLDAFSDSQVPGRSGRSARRTARAVYESAERVICVSEKVRARVLEGAPNAQTSVVYNGVDTDVFCPPADFVSRDIILSVGNLIPIKAHEVLLRAFARLHAAFPASRLQIIGDGPERRRLSELATTLGVCNETKFMGRQSRQQVARAMQECSIFALPSRFEGLGCVYLEAMSCAKPSIGCYGQGIEEVIRAGGNGCLVNPGDVQELENTLVGLLADAQARAKLGAEARKTIVQGFNLAEQARNLTGIYRECLA
jgi:glycosyltransferase involved in cell wall biosynthesis